MSQLVLPQTIDAGTPAVASEVQSNFVAVRDLINGNLEGGGGSGNNFKADSVTARELEDAARLGLSESGTVRRGKKITATEETTTSTSFVKLTTADQVDAIVLPTDGLIFLLFSALLKNSAAAVTTSAVFLGANQLVAPDTTSGTGTSVVQYAVATPARYSLLHTHNGIINANGGGFMLDAPSTTDVDPPVSTGQVFYGDDTGAAGVPVVPLIIQAAAGTYDISVQFKVASGTLSVKNRKLYVWTMDF